MTISRVIVLTAAFVAIGLAGCQTKKIMRDCEQINGSDLFVCKSQTEIQ